MGLIVNSIMQVPSNGHSNEPNFQKLTRNYSSVQDSSSLVMNWKKMMNCNLEDDKKCEVLLRGST